jgi:hypothetical protein
VETFKEYHNMLFGCHKLHVYTDHKNLTFNTLSTQRVLRWQLFIEELAPTFHCITGTDNTLANALSRVPFSKRQSTSPFQPQKPSDVDTAPPDADPSLVVEGSGVNSFYSMAIDDDDLLECFTHLPEQEGIPFNMNYQRMATRQMQNAVAEGTTLCGTTTPHTRHICVLLHSATECRMENILTLNIVNGYCSLVSPVPWAFGNIPTGRHPQDALFSPEAAKNV